MTAAQCIWPYEDIDIDFDRAIIEATIDIPRICEENRWTLNGDPTDWRETEGVDAHNKPALYLTCVIDVTVQAPETETAA